MLYMFNVDAGTMMSFDIGMSMELSSKSPVVCRVSVLQARIEELFKIPIDMQVLLASGGIPLTPSQRVCIASAGTDNNPIFFYNKQLYHNPSPTAPLHLLTFNTGPDLPDMQAEVDANLALSAAMSTVVSRSNLAERLHQMATDMLAVFVQLVYEQHMQHQGFCAVIANMSDTMPGVKANTEQFFTMFQEFLDNKPHYYHLLETVGEVASTLANIPLLPTLVDLAVQDPMTSISSCQEIEGRRDKVSLLDWLHLRNANDSFHRLSQMCSRGLQQHNEEILTEIQDMLSKVLTSSQDESMKTIAGVAERLSGLEKLLKDAREIVKEQESLAQGFALNSNRACNLGDASILPDLCLSHRQQLIVMLTNHNRIRDIHRRIVQAKMELIQTIYARMKWVYGLENQVSLLVERTYMYSCSLKIVKEQFLILQQTHNIPHLYLTAVAEVVRRRTFSQAFLMWANDLACQMCAVHSEEVARRQNFHSQFDGHMLNNLFPGLGEVPPPFATEAPEPFDTKLPKLSIEDLELLKEKVANLALSVSLPDFNAISQFFISKSIANPIKPKEVERMVEEVTAMEQPSENQTPSTGFLASLLPITDRGFESETDTEEFEKVGQSPVEQAAEKTGSVDQLKVSKLKTAKEEVDKSIVTIRNSVSSLKEWLQSEHNQAHSSLGQLTSDVQLIHELLYQLKQELSSRDEEIARLNVVLEEMQKRLTLSMESETRERELREQSEASKERAVKEATEQIIQDHRMEIEAVRSRFRLMTTASLERSPSELSLERMDQIANLESEEMISAVRAELAQERERAVAEERQRWQSKLDHELHQLKLRADAEKQIWFNEAMRRVLVEKDRQLESLRVHSVHMETECQKHRDTIHRLTGTSSSVGSESSLLERVEALEAAKVRLEAELAEARSSSSPHPTHSTPTHQDMSTSIALCDGDGGLRDAATSPDPVRKTQLKEKLSKSTTSLIQQGKVNIGTCNIGDSVLVVWDESHHSYMILQESSTLYFLHPDSLAALSLFHSSGPCQVIDVNQEPRCTYCLAEVIEKEYCHARKPANRYNVAKGTKFYRVKVKPFTFLPHRSQSSSGCSA